MGEVEEIHGVFMLDGAPLEPGDVVRTGACEGLVTLESHMGTGPVLCVRLERGSVIHEVHEGLRLARVRPPRRRP